MARQTLQERFWSKVHKTSSCWIWTAARWPNGYGHFVMPTHHALAHRVAWELTHGPIPAGLFVLHDCPGGQDNKACVNPQHLRLGTRQDNADDAIIKGQLSRRRGPDNPLYGTRRPPGIVPRGDQSPHTKVSEAQMAEVVLLYATGEWTQAELAKRYGVGKSAISYRLQAHYASLRQNEEELFPKAE